MPGYSADDSSGDPRLEELEPEKGDGKGSAVALWYAESVVKGTIPASKYHRLACKRFLDDLLREETEAFPYRFSREHADLACDFFHTFLRHSKGKWVGQAFTLQPWQAFIVAQLFGWLDKSGRRRFRSFYGSVPRKAGKSTLAAGVILYLTFYDGEGGAEGYCAATKKDQARIVWEEAARMVRASPALRKRLEVLRANINDLKSSSKLQPLGADSDTLDGLNVHAVVIDEVHAHKDPGLIEVLQTAQGAREQPVQFEITTAGWDRNSICWAHQAHSYAILEGARVDESWLCFITGPDEGDDWRDPVVWRKAQPNLGETVSLDWLKTECERAEAMPSAQNAFRRLNLNEWTQQENRAIDMAAWRSCPVGPSWNDLLGAECYGGLDLASTQDIAAFSLCFPLPGGQYGFRQRYWIPEGGLRKRMLRDRIGYDAWVEAGFMVATPGEVIDYDFIRQEVTELSRVYRLVQVSYDPWNATQLANQLTEDGIVMVQVRQGFKSMAEPTRRLLDLVVQGLCAHGADPVLAWMASNLCVRTDPNANMAPDKAHSRDKIDGIVAAIMALHGATLTVREKPKTSVYATRGLSVIGGED